MTVKSSWSGLKSLSVINRRRWMAVGAVVLAAASALFSQTTARANRITQEVTSGAIVTVKGTVHPKTQAATDLGAVSSDMQLGWMTLNISLTTSQRSELDTLIAAQQNPKSPLYHKWLTQDEYAARFGLTDSDLNNVTSWLKSQGFTVTGVSKARNAIHFSGKVWQVESAFHTQMHQYQLNGETHVANATNLRVPAAIGSVMLNVRGLENFRPKPHTAKRMAPGYTVNTSNGLEHFLTPADWATIYNVNAIYSAGYTGTGAHVGVVGQTYAPLADITNFRSASNLSAANVNYVCIDTTTTHCKDSSAIAPTTKGDLGEADLDIEWAGGIARDAVVDYVYAPWVDVDKSTDPLTGNYYDVFDALQYAVEDYTISSSDTSNGKLLPVLSMSYTDCEEDFYNANGTVDSSYVLWVDELGAEATTQGQTIVVASGDTGAAGCDSGDYPAKYGVSAAIPLDSTYYTGVGGTTLSGDESSPDTYWTETADLIDSAKQYIGESVWNDTSSTNGLSATGGGVSAFCGLVSGATSYCQPSWQKGLISGVTAGRMFPDVAFAASPDHDAYMACSSNDNSTKYGSMCSSGFISSNGYFDAYGGTSAATPSFAGMLTLIAQAQGSGLGNINPTLYSLAASSTNYASVFHDVTSGNNDVPCTSGTTGCVSGTLGYSALTGYDLTTGLGSVNGGSLLSAMITPLATTSTSVSALPGSVTMGDTTSLTATVNSSTAGTIGGSVIFSVNNPLTNVVHSLGTVLVSSGTATLGSVPVTTASGFAAGSDVITASYGGDTTFGSSSNTTTLTVASGPTYTLTASASSPTISAGGSSTITLNLASTNYTGVVSFVAVVTSSNGTATNVPTPSIAPVTLTSGQTGSTTVTIAPNANAANHKPAIPWKTGGAVIFCTVLLGAPFTFRRKRTLTVLLGAVGITMAGFMVACSGGSGSTTTTKTTSTSVSATPSAVALNGTTTLAATVTPSAASGTVTFTVGSTTLGSGTLSGGTTTLTNVAASTANGFVSGANTVTATYRGDSNYATSAGTGTVTVAAPRTYTVTITPTGTGTVTNPSPVVITVTVP